MSDKETKDYWSECGQIFFLNGGGYGLTLKHHFYAGIFWYYVIF